MRFYDTPEQFEENRTRCRFGITEGLGLLVGGLFAGGLGEAGAAAGIGALGFAPEAAAGALLPEIIVTPGIGLGAAGLGAAGLEGAAALGAGSAAAAGGLGLGGALEAGAFGLGLGGIGAAIGSGISGGAVTPQDIITNDFNAVAPGMSGQDLASVPAGQPIVNFSTPLQSTTPGTPSAAAFAPPSGVTAPAGATIDPTSAIAGNPGPGPTIDETIYGATGAGGTSNIAPDAAAGGGNGNFLDSLVTGAKNSITKNPLGIGLAGAGLAYNLLNNNANTPNTSALQAQAAQLAAQGKSLSQYLENGTLPPGVQTAVDEATKAAKARAMSNAAASGMSADPRRNSALAGELAGIDRQAAASAAQIAQSLLTTGINETGLSTQIYQALVNIDSTNNANIGKAIANFAGALGGGVNLGGLTVKTG